MYSTHVLKKLPQNFLKYLLLLTDGRCSEESHETPKKWSLKAVSRYSEVI